MELILFDCCSVTESVMKRKFSFLFIYILFIYCCALVAPLNSATGADCRATTSKSSEVNNHPFISC